MNRLYLIALVNLLANASISCHDDVPCGDPSCLQMQLKDDSTAEVISLHRQYVEHLFSQNPDIVPFIMGTPSFTMISRDGKRMVTYLGERHRGNPDEAVPLIENICQALNRIGKTVFIETPNEAHGLTGAALYAWQQQANDNGVFELEELKNPGIILNLLPATPLEALEAGELPFDMEKYTQAKQRIRDLKRERTEIFKKLIKEECELRRQCCQLSIDSFDSEEVKNDEEKQKLQKAIDELSVAIKELEENSEITQQINHLQSYVDEVGEIYHISFRDTIQGKVLDEKAPAGHSWAIGGMAHAYGVKNYLAEQGWTELPSRR